MGELRGTTWLSRLRVWLRGLMAPAPRPPTCNGRLECAATVPTRGEAKKAGWRSTRDRNGVERWTCPRCRVQPRRKVWAA